MPYAIEKVYTWNNVSIPLWIRAFDCRDFGDISLNPMGSEKAAMDLGIKDHYTTPVHCSVYRDLRNDDKALEKAIRDAIEAARKLNEDYLKAHLHRANEGEGGGVQYKPIAITVSNYGWAVIADNREYIVRRLG